MNLEDLSPELKEKALACKTPEELLALGVNCPRVTTLSRTLSARNGEEQPVCINLDEAENMIRRLIS